LAWYAARMLCPTPPERLCDEQGRPYFLWDAELRLTELQDLLVSGSAEDRAWWAAKVMRQAKPDDAITVIGVAAMRELWPLLQPLLSDKLAFWTWYLEKTRGRG